MGTGTTQVCFYCGRPVIFGPVAYGNSGDIYHDECTKPPVGFAPAQTYAPPPQSPGCVPIKYLSEADVRRIVQEELAKLPANDQREPLA